MRIQANAAVNETEKRGKFEQYYHVELMGCDDFLNMSDKDKWKAKKKKYKKESQFFSVAIHQIKNPGKTDLGPWTTCAHLEMWAGIPGELPHGSMIYARIRAILISLKSRHQILTV